VCIFKWLIFISINYFFIYTILSTIKKKLLSKRLCIKTVVFQYSFHEWKTVWFSATTGFRNWRHLFDRPWSCLVTSPVLSSVNCSRIIIVYFNHQTCCAPNCLLTEKTNPGYSFFTLPWDTKFKLDSWLKKLKLWSAPTL